MTAKKRNWKQIVGWIFLVGFSAVFGFFGACFIMAYFSDLNFFHFIVAFLVFILSFPLHIMLHELGHVAAGMLSGYSFVMFRLFSTVWIQTAAGISKRKQYVPGILGQALMRPPENLDKPPFLLYHSGGLIVNFMTAISLIWFGRAMTSQAISICFFAAAAMAIVLFVMNIVPVKGTDGYNILMHFKEPDTLREYTNLLNLYSGLVQGESFTSLKRFIDIDSLDGIDNPNTVTFYTSLASAYYEAFDWAKARDIYALLWNNRAQLIAPHKPEVYYNYLFTLYLTDPNHPDIEKVKNTQAYKASENHNVADGLKVRAAEAIYRESNFTKAKRLLDKGEPEIASAPTITEEKLEYQMYGYLRKEMERLQNT